MFLKSLKQALNNGLILKKVHRAISFNQSKWLKRYINNNSESRQKATNNFEKDFFKLKNKSVFRKTMENIQIHKDIKLVKTERRRSYLVSEPNFHMTTFFSKSLLATDEKNQFIMNKPVYLGLSTLDISKTKMYKFWYDYLKLEYIDKAKLCYMDK